jgi:hypothetical protein
MYRCHLGVLFEQLIVRLIGLHIARTLFEQFWDCSNNGYNKNLLIKMSNSYIYLSKKVKFCFSFVCILTILLLRASNFSYTLNLQENLIKRPNLAS